MLFTLCIFIELLNRKVPTVMRKFNICDTKTLEVHFHFDMFRCLIYHHNRGRESDQRRPSFRCEISIPDDGGIYTTEICRSESEPLKSLYHIY
jgi:hypothetical protein